MYVCTYQQIQDMLSLQSDCTFVTDQEEYDHPILYYKEDITMMYAQSVSVYMYNYYHYITLYHYMYMYLIVPYSW